MVRETRVQRKKRKLALYRRIAATILVLGLIICWSLRTKLLEIKEIKVEGNVNLSVEEIIEASKIQKGANLIITKSSKTEEPFFCGICRCKKEITGNCNNWH